MITADTITDEQIRRLRRRPIVDQMDIKSVIGVADPHAVSLVEHAIRLTCDDALDGDEPLRHHARGRCARILEARADSRRSELRRELLADVDKRRLNTILKARAASKAGAK